MMSRTVVIAGAGIGGLTAALALSARGFRVIVFEKAARLEPAGAGLQLSPNASHVLIGLGLLPRLAPFITAPSAVSIMTARSGGRVIRMPLPSGIDSAAPYWLLHRGDLQAALLAEVESRPGITLRLGQALTDFQVRPEGVIVGGEPALALIAADGVRSAVRGRLFPEITPLFSGLIAWRGTAEKHMLPPQLMPDGVQLWMGPRAHLVAYPMSSGQRVNMVAILRGGLDPAAGSSDLAQPGEISAHFADSLWPAGPRVMIDAVSNWRRWPLFTLPDGGIWHQGPVALLGDAAHAMLPFAAQGAGMAIEDAAVLSACLAEADGDLRRTGDALTRYEARRRSRVSRVQRMARQSGQIYHLRGSMALARDLTMRALGARRLQARQDWIYDWRI